MFKSRLIHFIIFSFLVHVGLSVVVAPVFDPVRDENFFFSWGEVSDTERSAPRIDFARGDRYREYLLPLQKQVPADLTKINFDSRLAKDLPRAPIEGSHQKKGEAYFLSAEGQD
ncbi:hypothetical protein ACFL5X_00835, partial [Candidatus Omnitrophota bacterium]